MEDQKTIFVPMKKIRPFINTDVQKKVLRAIVLRGRYDLDERGKSLYISEIAKETGFKGPNVVQATVHLSSRSLIFKTQEKKFPFRTFVTLNMKYKEKINYLIGIIGKS